MSTVVYKFGGTSLDSPDKRNRIIEISNAALNNGNKVVIVASAMGRKGQPYATDTLLSLLPSGKEAAEEVIDLISGCGECISACVLADAFKQAGIAAYPMTALQAGIKTDGKFGDAHITDIDTKAITEKLETYQVVIITGFQGYSSANELTTLGRGGSDTTALAVAGYLKADKVIIYTDVYGVAQTDPRIVPEAKYLKSVDFESMLFLAQYGAKVIHPNAVQTAMDLGVPFEIRHIMSDSEGTVVGIGGDAPEGLIGAVVCSNKGSLFTNGVIEKALGSIYADYEKCDLIAAVCDGSGECTPGKLNDLFKENEFSTLRYCEDGEKGIWLLPEGHGQKALKAVFADLYEKPEHQKTGKPAEPETT